MNPIFFSASDQSDDLSNITNGTSQPQGTCNTSTNTINLALSSSRRFPGDSAVFPVQLRPGVYSGKFPVDIWKMPIVLSPLIKIGNRVVICGRYPDENVFLRAAKSLGVKMISSRYAKVLPTDALTRAQKLFADWTAFHLEIYGSVPKMPTVSGATIDLFLFAEQVLLLGGIQTVSEKRGFVALSKQLRLKKPCTSAASVLRRAHQTVLHWYEKALVTALSQQRHGRIERMSPTLDNKHFQAWRAQYTDPTVDKDHRKVQIIRHTVPNVDNGHSQVNGDWRPPEGVTERNVAFHIRQQTGQGPRFKIPRLTEPDRMPSVAIVESNTHLVAESDVSKLPPISPSRDRGSNCEFNYQGFDRQGQHSIEISRLIPSASIAKLAEPSL